MGKVITVMNMKGGVGKTTVTMHIGGMLALYNLKDKEKKVLLIDYDPQFNLTQAFIPPKNYFALEKKFKTVLSVLIDDDSKLDPYKLQVPGNENPPKVSELKYNIYNTQKITLDLIPSTLDLMYLALGQPQTKIKPIIERFDKFIFECKKIYDYIFIDCHPAGSIFTKSSLKNSDHVIIPVVPTGYSVRGIGLMMQFIKTEKLGSEGPTPHILFNLVSRSGKSKTERDIRGNPRFADKCMFATLKTFKAFSEPIYGKGFVWASKKPYSTYAFRNIEKVSTELLNRIEVAK